MVIDERIKMVNGPYLLNDLFLIDTDTISHGRTQEFVLEEDRAILFKYITFLYNNKEQALKKKKKQRSECNNLNKMNFFVMVYLYQIDDIFFYSTLNN